jgi:hypothetical protein
VACCRDFNLGCWQALKLSTDDGFLLENICFRTKIHCLRVKKPKLLFWKNVLPDQTCLIFVHHLRVIPTKSRNILRVYSQCHVNKRTVRNQKHLSAVCGRTKWPDDCPLSADDADKNPQILVGVKTMFSISLDKNPSSAPGFIVSLPHSVGFSPE